MGSTEMTMLACSKIRERDSHLSTMNEMPKILQMRLSARLTFLRREGQSSNNDIQLAKLSL